MEANTQYVRAVQTIYNYKKNGNYSPGRTASSEISAVLLNDDEDFELDALYEFTKFWLESGWRLKEHDLQEPSYIVEAPNRGSLIKIRIIDLLAIN